MKKIFYPLAALLTSLAWGACSDDSGMLGESQSADSQSASQNNENIDHSQDLTFGYDLFISGIDTLSDQRIQLNTNVPVEVISRDGKITFNCIQEGGKYYLQPQMLTDIDDLSMLDKVTLRVPGNPNLEKSLYVSVRQNLSAASTRAEVSAEAKRLGQLFSYGIYPNHEIGEAITRYPILDDEIVAQHVDVNYSFVHKNSYVEVSGDSRDEVDTKWSAAVGLNNIPMKQYGKVSGSVGYKSSDHSKNYYQYSTRTRKLELGAGAINYNDDDFATYITPTLNKILNTNESLTQYPNTKEGIFKILDDYGPYVPTFCIMGASASYVLSKKQDLEMSSSEWDAQVSWTQAGDKKAADIEAMSEDQLSAYKYVREGAPSVKANFNYSNEKVLDNADLHITTTLLGGNAATVTSINDFSAGNDPMKWVALAYSGNGQSAQLQPLYKFCASTDSERYKLLKKYIDGDSYEEYYKHRKEYIEDNDEDTEWVIAGMKLKVTDDTSFAPFEDVCPDGETRTFYPMMFNRTSNYYIDYHGKVLDTQIDKFGLCNRRKQHVWFYALAMRDDCPGISKISFSDGYGPNEHNCMIPENSHTGTGWTCYTSYDSRLVVVPIEKGDKTTRPITAFALYDEDNHILASTGGTEYGDTPTGRANFKAFWQDADPNGYRKQFNNTPSDHGIYYLDWIYQPEKLYFMYSTRPLSLNADGKKYKIQHPSDMKKGNF